MRGMHFHRIRPLIQDCQHFGFFPLAKVESRDIYVCFGLTTMLKMANKMWNVIHHAIKTFHIPATICQDTFQSDFSVLKTMADDVKLEDLRIPPQLLERTDLSGVRSRIRSVEYIHAYDNADVSVGVFVLKEGAKLPIHDHPCMYGILKVVKGVVKITSYTVIDTDTSGIKMNESFFYPYPLRVIKHPEVILNENDSCCVLTPTEKNIHEVECINGPAAFLDILSPPYQDQSPPAPRSCHYFEETVSQEKDNSVMLRQIPEPYF